MQPRITIGFLSRPAQMRKRSDADSQIPNIADNGETSLKVQTFINFPQRTNWIHVIYLANYQVMASNTAYLEILNGSEGKREKGKDGDGGNRGIEITSLSSCIDPSSEGSRRHPSSSLHCTLCPALPPFPHLDLYTLSLGPSPMSTHIRTYPMYREG